MSTNVDNNKQIIPSKFFKVEAGSLKAINQLEAEGKLFSGFWSKYSDYITDGKEADGKTTEPNIPKPTGKTESKIDVDKSFFQKYQDFKDKGEQKEISKDSKGAWGDPHYDLVGLKGESIKFNHMGVKGNTYDLFEGDNIKVEGTYTGYNLQGSKEDFADVAALQQNQFTDAKNALSNKSLGTLDEKRIANALKIANGVKTLKTVDPNLSGVQKQQIIDENNKIKEQNKQFLQGIGVNMSSDEAVIIKEKLSALKGLNENKLNLIDTFDSSDHKSLQEEIAIMGNEFDPKNVTVIGKTTVTAGADKVTFTLPDAKAKSNAKPEIMLNGKAITGDGTFKLADGSTLLVKDGKIRIESAEKDSAIDIRSENGGITVDPEGKFYRMGGMIGEAINVGRGLQRSEADKFDTGSGYKYNLWGNFVNASGQEAVAKSQQTTDVATYKNLKFLR